MTFWEWVTENKTKILGSLTTLLSTLTGMIASGMFEGLLEPTTIRWIAVLATLVGVVVGGGTVAVGFSNTTKERVANSDAQVAVAKAQGAHQMAVAINAAPPVEPIEVVPVTPSSVERKPSGG